ncbi:Transcriptional regulator, MerR family [Sphingopyxis sp. LC81]|jgi:MerR family mercuric resistance operon transcriptional regulator|uniref:MerR family transcriptional regulator n=1 Tax=Sphingopyxis sp. LC81 TaxID=1502850 RepID=UPI00050DB629|nr:helix-turn-helix domain-containing protein [Sphingopyxis sp. LC81]KGB54708.1 Transcriptional regulator, MerR family [Sphingopyxis sp. LC81]
MKIGELSRRTGCNIETIRYYERIGVLRIPSRSGRFRSYAEEDARRLGFVRRARELGFTLDEVRALLELAKGGQQACSEVRSVAASHLATVRARIADLQRMEQLLADSVRACDAGDDPSCPLLQALQARPSPG